MRGERTVGGARCSEVLAMLSSYLDGELTPEQLATARAHLAGCDNCTRFGAKFARAIQALRSAPEVERNGATKDEAALLDALGKHID